FVNDMAGGIQNFQFQFPKKMTFTLVIINGGAVGRVIANERGVTGRPAALAFDSLLHGTGRNESHILLQQVGSQRTPGRNIVHDPDAAAVCGQNEVVVARVNGEIAHSDSGKMVALELGPVFAAVDGNPKAEFCAEK